MQRLYLFLFFPIAGCGVIDAQVGLVEQAHKGVQLVRESIQERTLIETARNAADRRRLDEAFDDDLAGREMPLTADWVLDARQAYAAAIDALHGRDAASIAARDADLGNLDAIDTALAELESLARAQRQFFLLTEKP